MEKHSKYRIWPILLLLVSGCATVPGDEFVHSFEQTETIDLQSQPVKLKLDNPFLSYMFEMTYLDSLLFINEFPDPEYCMKIVDLRNKTIRNFAKKGKGPNEMQAQACEFSMDYLNRNLYVTDHNNYYIYPIDSILNYKDIHLSGFPFRPEEASFLKTTYCNGYIVGNTIASRFAFYNINTKSCVGKYLYTIGPLVDQANFYSHPYKNIVAYFHSQSATIGLLHIENETITMKEYSWWKSKSKEISNGKFRGTIPGKDAKKGFITATVSEKYVYSLYSGKIFDQRSIETLTKAFISRYVYVHDWDGNPVKRYKLDQEVRSIALDNKNNTLYAASFEGVTPK